MENRLQRCPVCQSDLSEASWAGGEAYCHCGWSSQRESKKAERREESRRAMTLLGASFVFVLLFSGFLYLTTVGGQIFLIKQKISFGVAGPEELRSLSDRCLQLGEESCALEALTAASLLQPKKLDLLLDLARFQMEMGKFAEAAITYKTYLEKGGEDNDVVYRVGKALALAGDREEAKRYYEQAMMDKPGSVNLNATKGLIRLFIQDGRLHEARGLIAQFKQKTRSQVQYFSDELKMIEMAKATN